MGCICRLKAIFLGEAILCEIDDRYFGTSSLQTLEFRTNSALPWMGY